MGEDLKNIKAVVFDCDGVFTDGTITFDGQGMESRTYDMQDGMGITLLRRAGIFVAVMSSSKGRSIQCRMEMLGIEHCYTSVRDKKEDLIQLAEHQNLDLSKTAFVGDDLVDLAPMQLVGYPIAVSNAVALIKEHACYVTQKPGGRGAIREIAQRIVGEGGLRSGWAAQ